MSAVIAPQIRVLSLNALVLSETPIQVERRAQFNRDALKELSETIKVNGRSDQPITVRPKGSGQFEVADGERRVLATEMAGLETIVAEIRELTDEQVEEMQIVTGLQKERLNELVEAEGYEMLHKRGLSIDEIAEKVRTSKATVYARMKLLELCEDGRKAVREGKISASVGLYVARIPLEKFQKEAVKHLSQKRWNDEPWTAREASLFIQREFMLRLEQASFDVTDETLIKSAGACSLCPKNTICQPELFADVSTEAMCTDQPCFAAKKSAHTNRQIADLKAAGTTVFRGKEAKQISPHGSDYNLKGWIPLHQVAKDAMREGAEVAVIQLPNDPNRLLKIVRERDVKERKQPARSGNSTPASKKVSREQQIEETFDKQLYLALHAKAPKQLEHTALVEVVERLLEGITYTDRPEVLFSTWGWSKHGPSPKEIGKLSGQQLHQLVFELTLFQMDTSQQYIEGAAKRLGVDAKKIRADVAKSFPPAPAKASKKKVAKK